MLYYLVILQVNVKEKHELHPFIKVTSWLYEYITTRFTKCGFIISPQHIPANHELSIYWCKHFEAGKFYTPASICNLVWERETWEWAWTAWPSEVQHGVFKISAIAHLIDKWFTLQNDAFPSLCTTPYEASAGSRGSDRHVPCAREDVTVTNSYANNLCEYL